MSKKVEKKLSPQRIAEMRKNVLKEITIAERQKKIATERKSDTVKKNNRVKKTEPQIKAQKKVGVVKVLKNKPTKKHVSKEILEPNQVRHDYISENQHKKIVKKIKYKNRTFNTFYIILSIFLIIIVLILATIYYVPKSENKIATAISGYLPIPALIIDGKFISYNEFLSEVKMVEGFLGKQKDRGVITEIPQHNEIRNNIKKVLINKTIISQLAKENDITISDDEINSEIQKIKSQTRNSGDIDQVLNDLYGWTIDDFIEKVIKPYIANIKLARKYFPDLNINNGQELRQAFDEKIKEIQKTKTIFVFVE